MLQIQWGLVCLIVKSESVRALKKYHVRQGGFLNILQQNLLLNFLINFLLDLKIGRGVDPNFFAFSSFLVDIGMHANILYAKGSPCIPIAHLLCSVFVTTKLKFSPVLKIFIFEGRVGPNFFLISFGQYKFACKIQNLR